jgi:pSer/pThr/pTyr-binding forkhead associated (FHA) protein
MHERRDRMERETHRHTLEQIEGEGFPREITLQPGVSVIGRAPEALIHLPSKRVSRQHALLRVRGTDCVIADNESDNGIYLNGVKIHSAVLRDGDVIGVGDSQFRYREG